MKRLFILLLLAGVSALSSAAVIFLSPGDFLSGALGSAPPREPLQEAEEATPAGDMEAAGPAPTRSEAGEAGKIAAEESLLSPHLWPRGRISAARIEDRLVHRFVVERNIWTPPSTSEIIAEERTGAGPVVRFHTRGSRVEESESYRNELQNLPLGRRWPWYQGMIQEMGFQVRDATWSGLERPQLSLVKNGLYFVLELSCDSSGRVLSINASPNL